MDRDNDGYTPIEPNRGILMSAFCPYCGRSIGVMYQKAITHSWCRECNLAEFNSIRIWGAYSTLLQCNDLAIGSYLFSLYLDKSQLKQMEYRMNEQSKNLLDKLSGMEYPKMDDLLELHGLLQDEGNKAQMVASPDDLDTLHNVLVKVAEQSMVSTPTRVKSATKKTTKKQDADILKEWLDEADDDEEV